MRGKAAALAALVILLAPACNRTETSEENGETKITLNGIEANDRGSADVSGAEGVRMALEAGDFYFAPTVITGDPGQELDLDIPNAGEHDHNLSIPELEVDLEIPIGQVTFELVRIPESGTLIFFCKYHSDLGMAGALRVG